MSPKPPSEPTIESMDGEFRVITATMRGVTYEVRELPADEYEKCVKGATDEKAGTIANDTLFKLMLGKALIAPKMTVAEVMKKPYPVVRKLNDIIDMLHYTPEESDEEAEEEAEGEAKG